jgi:hypothetical protein
MSSNLRLTGVRSGLLQPDIVLPSQFFESRRKLMPEQGLMIAVLQDAIDCVAKYRDATDHPGRSLWNETMGWFLVEDSDWSYSFECICSVLDLDANAVRRALRLPERQSSPESHEVKKTLRNRTDSKGVAVKNRVARLTGTVSTGRRLEAAVAERSTPGVSSMQDDLGLAD